MQNQSIFNKQLEKKQCLMQWRNKCLLKKYGWIVNIIDGNNQKELE